MVNLLAMNEGEFVTYSEKMVSRFASWYAESGRSKENESGEVSRKMLEKLLPQGFNTPLNYFYKIVSEGRYAGSIWFYLTVNLDLPEAVLMDLYVEDEERRKGTAASALVALEELLGKRNISSISLKIPGKNNPAFSLFSKAGFSVMEISMRKVISSENKTMQSLSSNVRKD